MLPTGFDRSADADNDDPIPANQDPTSPEVGKKTIGISSPNFSVTVKSDFIRCNPETKKS